MLLFVYLSPSTFHAQWVIREVLRGKYDQVHFRHTYKSTKLICKRSNRPIYSNFQNNAELSAPKWMGYTLYPDYTLQMHSSAHLQFLIPVHPPHSRSHFRCTTYHVSNRFSFHFLDSHFLATLASPCGTPDQRQGSSCNRGTLHILESNFFECVEHNDASAR